MALTLGRAGSVSLLRRVLAKLYRELSATWGRRSDLHSPTLIAAGAQVRLPLLRRFKFLDSTFASELAGDFPDYPGLVIRQAQQAIEHRFNLLGSGWVTVAHGMRCQGMHGLTYPAANRICVDHSGDWLSGRINEANLPQAQAVWRLVDDGYIPIDWHLDFKSGYRWREDTWYRDVRYGHIPGVDVKVPWELSRLQHLPTLALAGRFSVVGLPGFQRPDSYARELRNQLLDFIATNPPRFGVNWACTMDVAIRVANMLVAHDLLLADGAHPEDEFEQVFRSSIVDHARHIAGNLEWSVEVRGNHYLANIAGLLFAAIYLPSDEEVDAWLAFSVQELITEVGYQFHEDGSNFEASVCYHRLSSEMVLWAFALLSDLPADKRDALARYRHEKLNTTPRLKPAPIQMHPIPGNDGASPIPDWCWRRLARMADFTAALTKPDGLVVQFGDNDSGRFLTVGSGEQFRADNEPSAPAWSLDHRGLVACIDALLDHGAGRPRVPPDAGARLVARLAGVRVRLVPPAGSSKGLAEHDRRLDDDAVWRDICGRFGETPEGSRWTSHFLADSKGLRCNLQWTAFHGMGCFVFRAPELYLAVRCGEIGLTGLGAHAHCDQLAIELVLNRRNLVLDPGTYVYTPFPERRNAYRSAAAHHVPHTPGREPGNNLTRGLFDLRGSAAGECLYFGPLGFIGCHDGYGPRVYRIIALADDRVSVHDFAECGLPVSDPTPAALPFSPGYGILADLDAG